MSFLHDKVNEGHLYVKLVRLLIDLRKFLETEIPETPESADLVTRLKEFTRNPV